MRFIVSCASFACTALWRRNCAVILGASTPDDLVEARSPSGDAGHDLDLAPHIVDEEEEADVDEYVAAVLYVVVRVHDPYVGSRSRRSKRCQS